MLRLGIERHLPVAGRVGGGDGREAGDQPQPERDEPAVDVAAGPGHVAVGVRHGHDREDGLDGVGARLLDGQQLVDGGVAHARQSHLAVGEGARRRPVHEVDAVLLLARTEGVPVALAAAGPPHLDHDLGVAVLREVGIRLGDPALLAIGGLDQDHRARAAGVRDVLVGVEGRPVVHRDPNVLVDVVGRGGGGRRRFGRERRQGDQRAGQRDQKALHNKC